MWKLLSLALGLGLGGAVGVVLVMLFSPVSGEQFVQNLKRGYAETMDAARLASAERRTELEAELAVMQKKRPAGHL
jgi:gas vesicle protein